MIKRRSITLLAVLTLLVLLAGLLSTQINQAQNVGTNWSAEFWNNTTLSGPAVTTSFYPAGVNFNWGDGPPRDASNTIIPGVNADNFSARFTSTQALAQTGLYRFTVQANDGVRVVINGVEYLNQLTRTVPDTTPNPDVAVDTFNVNIASTSVSMLVEYTDFQGEAIVQVQWGFLGDDGGGGDGTPAFTPTPQPPATGTVVQVRGLAVRTGPYLGASLIAVARPDTAYPVLARNFDEGLFIWYKVQVGDSTGWSSGRYLQITGIEDDIPVEGTAFEALGPGNLGNIPPALNVTGVTRSVMNLRLRPSERTQLLAQIPWGGEVEVFGRTIQGFDNHWLLVRYGDLVGWIYAPYVGLNGIVDAVPTY